MDIEHNNLFKAINEYTNATKHLAQTMAAIKEKHGRKVLQSITNFNTTRINSLTWLGTIHDDLWEGNLPETLLELAGETAPNIKSYAKKAAKQNLKANQLRKILREKNTTVVSSKCNVKTKVNEWGKNLLLLENSLKKMDGQTRQRALASLTNSITSLK